MPQQPSLSPMPRRSSLLPASPPARVPHGWPCSTSGAIQKMLPRRLCMASLTVPSCCTSDAPKSAILAAPSRVTRMLAPLMSRCITLWAGRGRRGGGRACACMPVNKFGHWTVVPRSCPVRAPIIAAPPQNAPPRTCFGAGRPAPGAPRACTSGPSPRPAGRTCRGTKQPHVLHWVPAPPAAIFSLCRGHLEGPGRFMLGAPCPPALSLADHLSHGSPRHVLLRMGQTHRAGGG
jgi:hypothetical protein